MSCSDFDSETNQKKKKKIIYSSIIDWTPLLRYFMTEM